MQSYCVILARNKLKSCHLIFFIHASIYVDKKKYCWPIAVSLWGISVTQVYKNFIPNYDLAINPFRCPLILSNENFVSSHFFTIMKTVQLQKKFRNFNSLLSFLKIKECGLHAKALYRNIRYENLTIFCLAFLESTYPDGWNICLM